MGNDQIIIALILAAAGLCICGCAVLGFAAMVTALVYIVMMEILDGL